MPSALPRDPVKVLYVLGSSRSGSTVLANLLGELPGFVSAGEVRFLWERLAQGRRCGCGELVSSCPLWSSVLHDLEDAGVAPAREMVRIDHDRMRIVKMRSLLRPPGPGDPDRATYTEGAAAALTSVAARSGCHVVVDSSKRPSNGAALLWAEGIDVSYLHLVRDARAVAASRSRRKPDPHRDGAAGHAYIGGTSVLDSSIHWTASNAASDLVRRAAGPGRSLLMRYEDFVRDPSAAISAIGSLLREPVDPTAVIADGEMRLGVNHAVSGNPDRFVTGKIPLRAEDTWRATMTGADRALAELLCAPLLLRYRYRIRSRTAIS